MAAKISPNRLALAGDAPGAAPAAGLFTAGRMWNGLAVPALSLLAFLALWEGLVRFAQISSYILPPPSAVLLSLWQDLLSPGYWYAVWVTVSEVVLGFLFGAVLGIGIGVALALSETVDRIFYPYVVALQTIPKVAVAPLMIVWFGFGIESKVLIVALTAMFPILINTVAGLKATAAERLDLLRGLCASRRQILRYVQFPTALPYVFAGLNTAIVLAVIGAIVGEFVGSKDGLGVVILKANFGLDLGSVFASLIVLGALGVILNAIVRMIERRICFWSGQRRL